MSSQNINGMINVYKERGFTSHDVVAKLRGILKTKKIGHTGTLDPDAEGVLPVCIGNATKLCDMIMEKTKEYKAVLRLGIVTDTLDITGSVKKSISSDEIDIGEEEIIKAVNSFIGEIDQIPPMYSAIKMNGKKLYELARAGIEVERKARKITIYDIVIEKIEIPDITLKVTCSKGTYIRTLCNDIGEKLGTGGCMASLIRLRSGKFDSEHSYTLSRIEEIVNAGELFSSGILVETENIINEYETLITNNYADILLHNGNILEREAFEKSFSDEKDMKPGKMYRVFNSSGQFQAVYSYQGDGIFKAYKMFL